MERGARVEHNALMGDHDALIAGACRAVKWKILGGRYADAGAAAAASATIAIESACARHRAMASKKYRIVRRLHANGQGLALRFVATHTRLKRARPDVSTTGRTGDGVHAVRSWSRNVLFAHAALAYMRCRLGPHMIFRFATA